MLVEDGNPRDRWFFAVAAGVQKPGVHVAWGPGLDVCLGGVGGMVEAVDFGGRCDDVMIDEVKSLNV